MGFFSRRRPLTAFEWKDAPPPSLCVASAAFVHCNSKHHCMTKSSHSLVALSSLAQTRPQLYSNKLLHAHPPLPLLLLLLLCPHLHQSNVSDKY